MICNGCGHINDEDACFCTFCGKPVSEGGEKSARRSRAYLFGLLLVPALIGAAALGYYKFVLPNGIIAVVNGDEIHEQELTKAVRRLKESINGSVRTTDNVGEQQLRYDVLMSLIRERILLQEVKKAGLVVTDEEVSAAADEIRKDSGMNDRAFSAFIEQHYGNIATFKDALRKRLLIERLISQKIAGGLRSPEAVKAATAKWLREVSAKANVRIALSEQWPGAGCGCCKAGASDKGAGADKK